jgi:hypothetical protein
VWVVASPVENAWNEPLPAKAPRLARAAILALTYVELYALSGHGGEV